MWIEKCEDQTWFELNPIREAKKYNRKSLILERKSSVPCGKSTRPRIYWMAIHDLEALSFGNDLISRRDGTMEMCRTKNNRCELTIGPKSGRKAFRCCVRQIKVPATQLICIRLQLNDNNQFNASEEFGLSFPLSLVILPCSEYSCFLSFAFAKSKFWWCPRLRETFSCWQFFVDPIAWRPLTRTHTDTVR